MPMRTLVALLLAVILAGCASSEAPSSTQPSAPQAGPDGIEAPQETVVIARAETSASVGSPAGSLGVTRSPVKFMIGTPNSTRAHAVATWNATTPVANHLVVHIFQDDVVVASASGASPLEMELPPGIVGECAFWVYPEDGSASIQDAVELHVSLSWDRSTAEPARPSTEK